jgi:hypothetical protein
MASTLGAGFDLALQLHTATCASMERLRDSGHVISTEEQYWETVGDRFARGLWRTVLEPSKQLESKCGPASVLFTRPMRSLLFMGPPCVSPACCQLSHDWLFCCQVHSLVVLVNRCHVSLSLVAC